MSKEQADIVRIGNKVFALGGTLGTSREVDITGSGASESYVQEQLNSLSGSLELAITELENFKPANIWYVDGINGDDLTTASGSFDRPYKTVGAALAAIGDEPLQTVFILAMDENAPTENVFITQSDLTLQGIGNTYSYAFTWNAHITFSGCTRIKIKDLHIRSTISGQPCVTDIESLGSHNFDNVTLTHTFENQIAYETIDAKGGGTNFINCTMVSTDVKINTPLSGDNSYNFVGCLNKAVTVYDNNFVMYRDSRLAGPFYHHGGNLIILNIITVRAENDTGLEDAIFSDATGFNVLSISNCGLIQNDGTYGNLNKAGDCLFGLRQVARNPAQDTLNGFRFYPQGSFDIDGSYTPINYTLNAPDTFIPNHLEAIDTFLGMTATRVDPPNLPNSSGITGNYAVDSNYLYFCISNDTWVRTSVSGNW